MCRSYVLFTSMSEAAGTVSDCTTSDELSVENSSVVINISHIRVLPDIMWLKPILTSGTLRELALEL